MILYDHTDAEARFLYEKAGFAAYCAYRAFELELDDRFDDAKQEAALTFWDLYRKGRNEEYAFVGAKYATMNFLKGKSPYGCLSLDVQHDDYSSPWEERLQVPHNGRNESNGNWITEADLRNLVVELFTGHPSMQVIDDYRRLLRHQLAGHSLRETAQALGKTYDATKALRRRLIVRLAQHYGVAPTWEMVAEKLAQEKELESLVLSIAQTPPPAATVEYNGAVLRLLMKGYDTAAIATELGRTEEGIKGARRDLKRHMVAHCRKLGIDPPKYNRNGGGWRPAHHYAQMGSPGQ
jgi:DNA-binding CsgD family transcriptional regulator